MSLRNQEYINIISPDIYDDEFINLINGLNESIKEYYKVSKYNVKETNNFLLLFEKQFKKIETSLNEMWPDTSSGNLNGIFQTILQLQNIVDQLQKNSKSNDQNLNLFFEDAKILFKKMILKRNETLMNFRSSQKSISSKRYNNAYNSIAGKKIFNTSRKNTYNDKTFQNIKNINITKIVSYLNQLKDYDDIIGKFSAKTKYNYIKLQKMIFSIINDEENELNLEATENSIENRNTNMAIDNKEIMNLFEVRNKYEKEISNLNNKIKDLEKSINENQYNSFQNKKLDELQKKIEHELINANNNEYNNINYNGQKNFEKMVLNIIDINKKLNFDINILKDNIKNKNDMIQNLNLNNNKIQNDLLDKDNIIQEKENKILTLVQDNERYKKKYEESNELIKNFNKRISTQPSENVNYKNTILEYERNDSLQNSNNKNSIIELRKELQNLYKENNSLRNEINKMKLSNNTEMNQPDKEPNFDKNLNDIKKELEIQKKNFFINKKKYENEINSLSKKSEDLSKQLTVKIQDIITLQKENIKMKTLLNDNSVNYNNYFYVNSQNNNNLNNELLKYKEENKKLKNILSNSEKEKTNLRNSLYNLNEKNNLLNNQIQTFANNSNYNKTILSLQQELGQLRKITEEYNYKSLDYEQKINNLNITLKEKDKLINQYKNNNANNEIKRLQVLNNNLRNEIRDKNQEINNMDNKLSNNINYNKTIRDLNNVINDDKKQITLLNQKIIQLTNNRNQNYLSDMNDNNLRLKINQLENHIKD